MTCSACKDAFARADTKLLAEKVDSAGGSEVCGCEKYQASDHSPGAVGDEEMLIILINDPSDLLAEGYLGPQIAMQIDRSGKSSLREKADNKEIEITYELIKANSQEGTPERFLHGFCVIPAGALRTGGNSETRINDRFMCIYDTGYKDRPHHADILAPDARRLLGSNASKTQIKKFQRARIHQLIEEIGSAFIPVDQFRNGVFNKYARG